MVALAAALIGAGAVAIVLAAGCNGGGDGGQAGNGSGNGDGGQAENGDRTLPPPGVVCTQIACLSEAQVRLADVPRRARSARVCVDGRCGDAQRIGGPAPFASAPVPERARSEGRAVRVTLELTDRRGETIRRATGRAAVRRVQPNGPQCPPICFQVQLRYDGGAGSLEPAPPRF